MFRINGGKGFQVTFKNGVTVSVQFGVGNYCKDYNKFPVIEDYIKESKEQAENGSPNAEIAIFNKDGWLTKEFKDDGDDVLGYKTPEQVLKALNWAKKYKA